MKYTYIHVFACDSYWRFRQLSLIDSLRFYRQQVIFWWLSNTPSVDRRNMSYSTTIRTSAPPAPAAPSVSKAMVERAWVRLSSSKTSIAHHLDQIYKYGTFPSFRGTPRGESLRESPRSLTRVGGCVYTSVLSTGSGIITVYIFQTLWFYLVMIHW